MTSEPLGALPEIWHRPFELAWEALTVGSYPIGAVLLDADGRVIAEARNRMNDLDAPPGQLARTSLAHAEMNVLTQLPPDPFRDAVLFTTLQPCLMCAASIRMARIGRVEYAAADPLWAGMTRVPSLFGPTVARHWPDYRCALTGPLASWGTALLAIRHLTDNAPAKVADLLSPALATLGVRCVDAGVRHAGSAEHALQLAWPLLVEHAESTRH